MAINKLTDAAVKQAVTKANLQNQQQTARVFAAHLPHIGEQHLKPFEACYE